jgi:hypothetical protein
VDGAQPLQINTSGQTTLGGVTGGSVSLNSLGIGGAVNLNGGNVTTTGNQTYGGAVTLGNVTALTSGSGGNISINSTLGGAQTLQINGSGMLTVDGTISASSVNINSPARLGGNGTINAPVTVQAGAILLLSPAIQTLTINNTLTLSGTVSLEVNASGLTSDLVKGITALYYGGTLNVSNLVGTLANSNTFTLFNASTYHNSFGALQLPTPPNGLAWDTSALAVNGSIKVVTVPHFSSIKRTAAHTFQLTASGAANQFYNLMATTDLKLPVSQWSSRGSVTAGSDGSINYTDSNATNPICFYLLSL